VNGVEDQHYFAYGSNMLARRLQQRLNMVVDLGPAWLDDYDWCCNKLGLDGTAKANLVRKPGVRVFGVLYEINPLEWPVLDQIEGGYRRIEVDVSCAGQTRTACTYISTRLTDKAAKSDYLDYILTGAEEHLLPREYIENILPSSIVK
jgi:gamma-glutamylcyclotransferase